MFLAKEERRQEGQMKALRGVILETLLVRFGTVPEEWVQESMQKWIWRSCRRCIARLWGARIWRSLKALLAFPALIERGGHLGTTTDSRICVISIK